MANREKELKQERDDIRFAIPTSFYRSHLYTGGLYICNNMLCWCVEVCSGSVGADDDDVGKLNF